MVSISIILSVVTINMYRKQAFSSEMPHWQRWLFVQRLPKLLRLKTLEHTLEGEDGSETTTPRTGSVSVTASVTQKTPNPNNSSPVFPPQRLRLLSLVQMDEALKQRCAADNLDLFRKIAGHLKIISAHFHNQQMESKITEEWQLMSLVIDRIFLILFLAVSMAANIMFVYNSPTLFDDRPSLIPTVAHKPLSGGTINVLNT
uniref:Neur_chan_memb domain-containing protein n=1 Tax=Caenorhabditis tropicalis TaxID=1561998 RepID=A0A1I7T983_9PELO